ncbi:MAG: acyl carrier protein [Lachnospiraceae bacterium]|nr:acyl carrier protein [Lachnospiraceae bacterium]
MSRTEILERVNDVFREVFEDDDIAVTESTTANDIEDWDSLMHITLISEIEAAFGFRFAMKDVVGMKDVGEMLTIIEANATK